MRQPPSTQLFEKEKREGERKEGNMNAVGSQRIVLLIVNKGTAY